jgi:hypothetical protein
MITAEEALVYDLEEIVEHIRTELPGVRCYVEQTGGGVATIYLGWTYCVDREGRVVNWPTPLADYCDDRDHDVFIPVMAGPGYFDGPNWTQGRCLLEELSVGYDVNDPVVAEDPGVDHFELDPVDERGVAQLMVRLFREHPRVVAGELRTTPEQRV